MRNWQEDKVLLSHPRPYLFNSRKPVDIFARFLIAVRDYVKGKQRKKRWAEKVVYR